jgi:hypothetical protein
MWDSIPIDSRSKPAVNITHFYPSLTDRRRGDLETVDSDSANLLDFRRGHGYGLALLDPFSLAVTRQGHLKHFYRTLGS